VGGAGAGLFNAVNRGVKFKIVAPMHSERPPMTSALVISMARKDEIKSVADLKGKRIAQNAQGGAGEYWLTQALKEGGLTLDDITTTTVGFADVPAALKSKAVDAAILSEPYVTQAEDSGTVAVLSNDFINGFTATYLSMADSFLADKPQLARGFLRAYLRACRDLQGSYLKTDSQVAGIIEKYTQVPASVISRASAPSYSIDGVVPVKDIMTLQDFFIQRGELEYKTPIDVTTFVDDSLARQVASELK
jgi:NitT/TauT family transport system substrate-binding protein